MSDKLSNSSQPFVSPEKDKELRNQNQEIDPKLLLAGRLVKNLQELIELINSKKGRWSTRAEQFVQTIFTGLSGNDVLEGCKTKLIDDVFGLSCKTVRKRMKQGENHRLLIKTDDEKFFALM